jgi:hypothetical protein
VASRRRSTRSRGQFAQCSRTRVISGSMNIELALVSVALKRTAVKPRRSDAPRGLSRRRRPSHSPTASSLFADRPAERFALLIDCPCGA